MFDALSAALDALVGASAKAIGRIGPGVAFSAGCEKETLRMCGFAVTLHIYQL